MRFVLCTELCLGLLLELLGSPVGAVGELPGRVGVFGLLPMGKKTSMSIQQATCIT